MALLLVGFVVLVVVGASVHHSLEDEATWTESFRASALTATTVGDAKMRETRDGTRWFAAVFGVLGPAYFMSVFFLAFHWALSDEKKRRH